MGAAGSSTLALPVSCRPAQLRPFWLGAAALGLTAVVLGTVVWRRTGSRRRRRLQRVGTVARLWIYPVKSCKGVAVSEAECTALGLRSGNLRDRFWLVIDETGNMVTARQEPRLVMISMTDEGDTLTLRAPSMEDLLLPLRTPTTGAVLKCRVHGLDIPGRDCGEAAARWMTGFLKTQPCRLVHFEPHMRPRKSHQIKPVFRPADQVAYADTSPLLVLSEASLADLNCRLQQQVKAANFRPNILISGCAVYAEDSWDELCIGDVELRRVMACSRCVLTTVDPDTGVMSRKEPLETLKRIQALRSSVKSGMRCWRNSERELMTMLVFIGSFQRQCRVTGNHTSCRESRPPDINPGKQSKRGVQKALLAQGRVLGSSAPSLFCVLLVPKGCGDLGWPVTRRLEARGAFVCETVRN
ncbi:mitochondrial amidoxime-reducing component 1-like isoform 1-T1 [Glossophaga mutica]